MGLLSAPLEALKRNTSEYEVAPNGMSILCPANLDPDTQDPHPLYPGATILVGHRNTIVTHYSDGYNLLYADANGTYLPKEEQIKVQDDSIYDLASLTKLFTTLLALDALGRGDINLKEKVATYLPDFAEVSAS